MTCSQDSVVFWDYKSFSSKRSAQPFGGSGYHVSSACWNTNSKPVFQTYQTRSQLWFIDFHVHIILSVCRLKQ